MDFILAHDVGTSGTKAVLITPNGVIVATAFEPYPTAYPRPLWAEQDPGDWWQAIARTTRRVVESAKAPPSQIIGMAFTTQMVNLIPVDAAGEPLRPCISWLDGRAGDEARGVMRRLGGGRIFSAIVGAMLTGKDLLPKMLWLKRHEPQLYERTAYLLDCSGYLLWKATRRMVAERSVASATGLLNLKSKTWDQGLMRFFGLDRHMFPELAHSTERVGGLAPEAARQLGLRAGTPVFAGAGDAQAAAVGAGAVGEGDGHLVLGTSGFVGVITARRVIGKRGIVTLQSADPEKLLLIGEMETAASCLRWAVQHLYGETPSAEAFRRMDDDAETSLPGARNLIFTPWMYGERAPVADERLRAAFVNLGANHARPDMVRAMYEGVAYNLRWLLDSVQALFGFRPDPLRVIGGGAKSRVWVQILADITGRRMEVMPSPQESSALGAGLLAAVGLGLYPSVGSLRHLISPEQTVTPTPEAADVYQRSYETFQQIYRALRPIHHRMNATSQAGGPATNLRP